MKTLLPSLKALLRKMGFGKHSFLREIPKDKGVGLSMQRYKEDMNVHTPQSECATIEALPDIIALDTMVMLELEPEREEGISTFEEWSLRDPLTKQTHNDKNLFRAITMQEDGTVIYIVCREDSRDEAMANIIGTPAA